MSRRFSDGSIRIDEPEVYVERRGTVPIADDLFNPQGFDPRFTFKMQTIYLAPGFETTIENGVAHVKGASYLHGDLFVVNLPFEEISAAYEAAEASGAHYRSAKYHQTFLRVLFKSPDLVLVHMMSGVNVRTNGMSYLEYGCLNVVQAETQADEED